MGGWSYVGAIAMWYAALFVYRVVGNGVCFGGGLLLQMTPRLCGGVDGPEM